MTVLLEFPDNTKYFPSKLESEALKDSSLIAAKNNLHLTFRYDFDGKENSNSLIRLESQEVNKITHLIAITEFSNGNLSRLNIHYDPLFTKELSTDLKEYEGYYKTGENIK